MGEEEKPGPQSSEEFRITKVLVGAGVPKIPENSLICPAIANTTCDFTKRLTPDFILGAF
jgi:hypothetical protein